MKTKILVWCLVVALAATQGVVAVAGASALGDSRLEGAEPAPAAAQPVAGLLVVTSSRRLTAKFGAGGWNQISAAIATLGGQVLDVDLDNWSDVDARIEAVGAANVGVILIVGDHTVVPFGIFPNVDGCPVHTAGYQSDDYYGDFDRDALTLVDVPVSRIPDGNDLNLVLTQLAPARAASTGSFALGSRDIPCAGPIANRIGAQILWSPPTTVNNIALPAVQVRHDYFQLHGSSSNQSAWFGKPSTRAFDITVANSPGIIWTNACHGAFLDNFGLNRSLALTFLRNGSTAFVGATCYEWHPTGPLPSQLGPLLTDLFWTGVVAGMDPLQAFFNAKRQFPTAVNMTPTNVKTLHEFVFYGRPFALPQPPPTYVEPWDNPAVQRCIDEWMLKVQTCANQTWPDRAPFTWSQWGLLTDRNSQQVQPPADWYTRYETNKYKWIWLEYDDIVVCPPIPSVQDYCASQVTQPVPAQPVPPAVVQPWDNPAVQRCIDEWMLKIQACANRTWPDRAPYDWSPWGLLTDKNSQQVAPHDDWHTRYEANKYKFIWLEYDDREICPGIPSVQDYCAGQVTQPVQPQPVPPTGVQPWDDPTTRGCIDGWMLRVQDCSNRTWPDRAPYTWSQWGLMTDKNSQQVAPHDDWQTRYEANKYKFIWLEYDDREICPGVPSVQDLCAAGAPGPPQPPTTGQAAQSRFFCLDNSYSMVGDPIEEAKRAALATVAGLPAGTEMALQFFGTSGCDVELVLGFTTDRDAMSAKIAEASARGDTPLDKAIREAAAYVRANAASADRVIVLLTDGIETCGGDPEQAAREINMALSQPTSRAGAGSASATSWGEKLLHGASELLARLLPASSAGAQEPPVTLHVVGFGIQAGSAQEEQLKGVAAAGGGQYFPAGTEQELTQALQQAATQPAALKGDTNGDGRCTEVDALAVLRAAVGSSAAIMERMDVNGDGQVSEVDALQILRWAVAGGQCGAGA